MATNFLGWVSTLARRHTRGLAAVAVREGLTHTDAIDAVQEAFVTLLSLPQARELSLDDENASHLMTTLVRNAARNMRRRHHRVRPHDELGVGHEIPTITPSVDALLASAEEHMALLGCVAKLGEVQRYVVSLRALEELSAKATAAELGLTPGNVGVLLHRAKSALLDCLAREGEPPPLA